MILPPKNIMCSSHGLKILGRYAWDDIIPYEQGVNESIRKFRGDDGNFYYVKMNSPRYKLFEKNNICVACGLVGFVYLLERRREDEDIAHFNLYGVENNTLILMTKDHILPKANGGKDRMDNYQTMCYICNQIKTNLEIRPELVGQMRQCFVLPHAREQRYITL